MKQFSFLIMENHNLVALSCCCPSGWAKSTFHSSDRNVATYTLGWRIHIDGYKLFRGDGKRVKKSAQGRFIGGVGLWPIFPMASSSYYVCSQKKWKRCRPTTGVQRNVIAAIQQWNPSQCSGRTWWTDKTQKEPNGSNFSPKCCCLSCCMRDGLIDRSVWSRKCQCAKIILVSLDFIFAKICSNWLWLNLFYFLEMNNEIVLHYLNFSTITLG